MGQLGLFETPDEKKIRQLPAELAELVERLQIAWGDECLLRKVWVRQIGAFGNPEPEKAFLALVDGGVLVYAGDENYQLGAK